MPSKYIVRHFFEDGIYHIYNKGFEGRDIFLSEKDYNFFQVYLFIYLRPVEEVLEKFPDVPKRLQGKNLSKEIELLGYCLLSDHFHLLLKQKSRDGISKLMKQLTNAYTLFFNQKNTRSGALFQGRYRAVGVNEGDLKQILRFIHHHPVSSNLIPSINTHYEWSSYAHYLGQQSNLPCSTTKVLSQFSSIEEFEKFHKDSEDYAKELEKIKHLTID